LALLLELPLRQESLILKATVLLKQFLAGFSLVGFLQSEKRRGLTVPLNLMPEPFEVLAHDLELCDRSLVPVLDLAQDRF
jgi:hypothetical protein